MNNKILYAIIGILVVVIVMMASAFSVRDANWKELKTIDDSKAAVDHSALQACVDGWDATANMSISKLDKATDDMSAARTTNKEVTAKRDAQLKKLGY